MDVELRTYDDFPLAARLFPARDGAAKPKGAVLIVSAMGVPQRFYAPMAEWLAEQGLDFTIHNVGNDAAARQRAITLSGQTLVPVIEVDQHVLGDFDVDQLKVFLKRHGYAE